MINKQLDFKFWEDILYYDGPLLSLCITEDKTHVLMPWADRVDNEVESYNLYAYIYLSQELTEQFLNGEKNYYQAVKESEKIITWKHNGLVPDFDFKLVSVEEFLEKYGPKETSDLAEDVVEVKTAYEKFKDGTYEYR